jgi:hypothetical protein
MSIQVVQHSQRFLEEETEDGYKPCDPSIIVAVEAQVSGDGDPGSREHAEAVHGCWPGVDRPGLNLINLFLLRY